MNQLVWVFASVSILHLNQIVAIIAREIVYFNPTKT